MATIRPNPIAMFLGTSGPAELKLDGVEATATNGHVVHFVLSDPVYGTFAPQNAVMPAPNAAGESRITSTFTPAAVTPPGAVVNLSIVDQDTGVTLATAQLTVTAPAAAPGPAAGAATGPAPAAGGVPATAAVGAATAPPTTTVIRRRWGFYTETEGATPAAGGRRSVAPWLLALLVFLGAVVCLILTWKLVSRDDASAPSDEPTGKSAAEVPGGSDIKEPPKSTPTPQASGEEETPKPAVGGVSPSTAVPSFSAANARAAAIAACVDASCRR